MPVFQFGAGVVYATPNAGDTAANPTPMQVGTLQDIQVDFNFELKKLYGRNQFPDDVAKGKGAITWKAKFGKFNGKLVNDLLFGQAMSTGQKKTIIDEVVTVAAGSATVAQTATFVEDLGVRYSATGKLFTKVASAPALGQYTNSGTGTYTFNTGDNGTGVALISYTYTVATGVKVTGTNQLMGFGPKFALNLTQQYGGNQSNLKLFACTALKFNRPTKNDDYTIMEIDGEAFSDAANNVYEFHDPEN